MCQRGSHLARGAQTLKTGDLESYWGGQINKGEQYNHRARKVGLEVKQLVGPGLFTGTW